MMIDQISIQSRIVCTSTVNPLTFVFPSTLTHLKHSPNVWPCIGNVNNCYGLFDMILPCKLNSHFYLYVGSLTQHHRRDVVRKQTLQSFPSLASLALLDSLVNQAQDLDLTTSFESYHFSSFSLLY